MFNMSRPLLNPRSLHKAAIDCLFAKCAKAVRNLALIVGTIVAVSTPAWADCDKALIVSTYASSFQYGSDWRLAEYVTRETYDELKKGGNLNTELYGVPVGANWDEYHAKWESYAKRYNERLTIAEARNELWTGLGEASAEAYKTCVTANRYGLHLVVVGATESDITLRLRYSMGGNTPPLAIKWLGAMSDLSTLPKKIFGDTPVVVPRPLVEQSLAATPISAKIDGTEAVVLTPLRKAPPALPKPPCTMNDEKGQCRTCEGTIRRSMAEGDWSPFSCNDVDPRQAYVLEIYGTVSADQGHNGQWVIVSADFGSKSANSGNIQSPNSGQLAFSVPSLMSEADHSRQLIGGLVLAHCQTGQAQQDRCSVDASWRIRQISMQ